MGHELATQLDGRIAMAYRERDALPWHAGETNPQIIPTGAPIEQWGIEAGLNYRVQVTPNHRADGTPIDESYYIERTDNGHITGPYIAGAWQPVQNSTILKLADSIRDRYGYDIITAGALFDGAKAWVQLETNLRQDIGDGDEVTSRPTLSVAHTGKDANTFISGNLRVVCNNTFTMAMEAGEVFRHDHRVAFDPEAVETALGLNADNFGAFCSVAKEMAARALSDQEALEYFQRVLGGKEKQDGDKLRRPEGVRKAFAYYRGQDFVAVGKEDESEMARYISDRLDKIASAAAQGLELPADVTHAPSEGINPGYNLATADRTLWGAFNTVTWLADQRPIKNRGTDHAIASHLFGDGTGGTQKAKAHKVALEMLAA